MNSEVMNRKNGIDISRGTVWYNGVEYYGRVNSFSKGQMALRLEVKSSEAYKSGGPKSEPIRVTYNMGNYMGMREPMKKNCSFLNVGEYPEIEDFVKKTGLAKPVLKDGEQRVRYNKANDEWYPVYEFDAEKLKVLDEIGYSNYSKYYDKQAAYEESHKSLRESKRFNPFGKSQYTHYDDVVLDDMQM